LVMAFSHEHINGPYKEMQEKMPAVLPLSDPRVQVRLAEIAYPESAKPMIDWLNSEVDGLSLAERFGAYRDASHTEETLGTDLTELHAFLKKIRTNSPSVNHQVFD